MADDVQVVIDALIDEGDEPICERDAVSAARLLVASDLGALDLGGRAVRRLLERDMVIPGAFVSAHQRSAPAEIGDFVPWSGDSQQWTGAFDDQWYRVMKRASDRKHPVYPHPGEVLWMLWRP